MLSKVFHFDVNEPRVDTNLAGFVEDGQRSSVQDYNVMYESVDGHWCLLESFERFGRIMDMLGLPPGILKASKPACGDYNDSDNIIVQVLPWA